MSIAKKFAMELSALEFSIISGMARGIDASAHQGTLDVGGKTVAVLGCGLDVIYPPENQKLYYALQQAGTLVTEFPFGYQPDKTTFPRRNRIISGLSQAVIVVETSQIGGSMITARMASEQGRHIFAVPGRIDQNSSQGCHALIRDGATLLTSVNDILDELNYLKNFESKKEPKAKVVQESLDLLMNDEEMIYRVVKEMGPIHGEKICSVTGYAIAKLSATLMMLELKRYIKKCSDGTYEAVPR